MAYVASHALILGLLEIRARKKREVLNPWYRNFKEVEKWQKRKK